MGKRKRKVAAEPDQARQEAAASPLPDKAKKKLLKLTQRLQQPGLSPVERLQLLDKLDKRVNKAAAAAQADGPAKPLSWNAAIAAPQRARSAPIAARTAAKTPEELARMDLRMARFQECLQDPSPQEAVTLLAARSASQQEGAAVLGRSTALEKEYLRLTSMPTLDAVRPPAVLQRALRMVQQHWLQEADYAYACEQLKSIRQDLTVQLIRTRLTVQVYETHGRIALEQGDIAEFNQCLAALKQLYGEGVAGNEMEFLAYGVLYSAITTPRQLAVDLRELPQQAWQHPYLQHALQVCLTVRAADAQALLDLYAGAPRMAPYLMDRLLERLRGTLAASFAAFQPSLSLTFAGAQLGFDNLSEARTFVEERGAAVDPVAGVLVMRGSRWLESLTWRPTVPSSTHIST